MSSPVYSPPMSPIAQVPRTWFGRNWKWFVPTLVVTFLTIFGLFIFAILSFVFGTIRSSGPYQTAIERTQQNPVVWEKIGHPVRVGRFFSGSINISGDSGNAELSIPIYGDHGAGHILVSAKKREGKWTYQVLEVHVDADGTVIPLLGPGAAAGDDSV